MSFFTQSTEQHEVFQEGSDKPIGRIRIEGDRATISLAGHAPVEVTAAALAPLQQLFNAALNGPSSQVQRETYDPAAGEPSADSAPTVTRQPPVAATRVPAA